MLIRCPGCAAPIKGKPLDPGRYTPKCPKCGDKFALVVAATTSPLTAAATVGDPNATATFDGPPEVAPSQAYQPSALGYDATEGTGGYIAKETVDATAALPFTPPNDTEATTDGRPAKANFTAEMPDELDGYELIKPLGAGGMGAVYLARQASLDRPVALKVMHPRWATDPVFVARFTREAYAAAQLTHHNVVQIYDFGEDAGVNFFSMEFVDGRSLGDLFQTSGKLEPAAAVGYVVQAARGLKFAHDRGMIHRDIKPDNLMVNSEGLVKVADLGLVKTAGLAKADDAGPAGGKLRQSAGVTAVGSAMGSPLYMSPEQCRDATGVDARADIYSLGCTLFALLSGRTPFDGRTPMEVLRKHETEPPPPLRSVAPAVSPTLAAVVDRTLRKDPAERFQSMDELVTALKDWQEADKAGPPRPTPDQVTLFEGLTGKLAGVGSAKLAAWLAVAVPAGLIGLGAVLLFLSGSVGGAVMLAGLAAGPAGLGTAALVGRSHLFRTARRWAFGLHVLDWLTLAVAAALFFAGLYLSGFLAFGLGGLIVGTLLGVGWAFAFVQPAEGKRDDLQTDMEGVLKRLRLAGMDEDAVRDFVATAAGSHWPAVYEQLFGYPAMDARRGAGPRGLRDKLVAWFEAKIQARQERRTRRHLQKLERKRLEAEGVSAAEAKGQAADAAADLIAQGAVLRASRREKTPAVDVRRMLTRYEKAKLDEIRRPRRSLVSKVAGAVFDPRLRLLAGAALVVGGLMWVNQNRHALAAVETAAGATADVRSAAQAQEKAVGFLKLLTAARTEPLRAKLVPEPVAGLFDSFNPVAAGVLLVLSALSSRGLTVWVMTFAAVACLLLHKLLPVPDVGPLTGGNLTLVVGSVAGVGVGAGRRWRPR